MHINSLVNQFKKNNINVINMSLNRQKNKNKQTNNRYNEKI